MAEGPHEYRGICLTQWEEIKPTGRSQEELALLETMQKFPTPPLPGEVRRMLYHSPKQEREDGNLSPHTQMSKKEHDTVHKST